MSDNRKAAAGTEKGFYSWGADAVNTASYAAYVKKKGTGSVTVGVVDTGVSAHPLLKNRLLPGIDYVDGDDTPNDETGHGTHIAGIIADCTPGLSVKILPVRVLDDMEGANCSIIGEGIRYAADHGCDVINLSLGGEKNQYIDDCVQYALGKNCVVVAASGNGYGNTSEYSPQHLDEIIVVGAVDQNDRRCFCYDLACQHQERKTGSGIGSKGEEDSYIHRRCKTVSRRKIPYYSSHLADHRYHGIYSASADLHDLHCVHQLRQKPSGTR